MILSCDTGNSGIKPWNDTMIYCSMYSYTKDQLKHQWENAVGLRCDLAQIRKRAIAISSGPWGKLGMQFQWESAVGRGEACQKLSLKFGMSHRQIQKCGWKMLEDDVHHADHDSARMRTKSPLLTALLNQLVA